ncbi:hypothetical protein CIPAW_12G112100 [Carya illinoinensis]|uniref:non-specific serine/threonine protein kinase n=1 Tax=Carya illinoinensis TaxID=32201 RepID=A0A8T1NYI3_CARIL|nr:hypothetical protein CIPAW_12G112100 [Carya illinoinensis]
MFLVRLLLASNVIMVCFATFASGASKLPVDEVEALRDIFNTLGKKDWRKFSDPCTPSTAGTAVMDAVNCSNCVINGSESYRVVGIFLKRQNLTGTLPQDLVKLPCLQVLDLAGNYLNGSIPSAWGSMRQLVTISLYVNRVTGSIPRDLANIRTLRSLTVAFNKLYGNLPPELGTMSSLETLSLSSNNFTGELPPSFANLTSLQDFEISDNQFSGQIPDYIQNWKNLTRLFIQASGLRGPIPPLDLLKSLSELRISDLNESDSEVTFPLKNINISQWKTLILRNCNLTGQLPDQIVDPRKTDFKTLDLSFNRLSGRIPPSFKELQTVDHLYLTRNLLTGPIPAWILNSTKNIDLSFNSFTIEKSNLSSSRTCQNREYPGINLFKSSSMGNETGKYTVRLHFAEIVFTDDETYSSLGRRIFDIYIQEKQVRKDFDIVKEAGGVRKPYIESFNAVVVNNSTLQIRFYWAGKGTTDIPSKGDYGPLISAISVEFDNEPSSISIGAMVGIIVAGAFVIILFVVAILLWKGYLGQRSSATDHDLRGLDLKTGTFTLRQIKTATNNFDAANKIGEGGFGSVYKGLLSDGTMVAVKQLSSKSKQGNREFLNEIGMISALQHPHLVKLYGCCVEGNQLLLVYEYMENNSLARALFGPEEYQLQLDWPTRHRICVGIARGLAYLHEESRLKIVHRDIKATNVLLDKNLNPKISDFGMAKLDEEDNTHISTRIAGTYGYMAPEYALHGYLTDKADVYSFGIVALEIVSGKSNTSHRPRGESLHLLDWALVLKEKGNLLDLADPRLGSNYRKEDVMRMINVALLCANVSAAVRPTMSSVVSMLEGSAVIPELGPNLSIVDDEMKVKALWDHFQDKKESSMGNSQTQSVLTDDQFTGTTSSTSAVDLYPINMDSSYWEKRV